MNLSRREFVKVAGLSAAGVALSGGASWADKSEVVQLLNGKNLDGWYTFLPSKGKNNDPEGIFKVEKGVLHVLGKEFGYVCTEKEYENFHLSLEFKWGEKKFPPRENAKRDSGILYHFPVGKEDKVWPHSIECQVQEGDCGDFWLVAGTTIEVDGQVVKNYSKKKKDAEKPNGEWNKVAVICNADKCVHVVNGVTVHEGVKASVTKGKILLQSEGAEVYYRKVELRPLKAGQ